MKTFLNIWLLVLVVLAAVSCQQEIKETVTLEDYQRAESFLRQNTDSLVYGIVSSISFAGDQNVIFSESTSSGTEYFIFNIQSGSKDYLFNNEEFSSAFNEEARRKIEPHEISIRNIELSDNGFQFTAGFTNYAYNSESKKIEQLSSLSFLESVSPDGKKAAYIKDFNLWVRDIESGKETQLTFDGEKDYGYATNNAGWTKGPNPILKWSPQSDKIATFRHDGRNVGEMYLWSTKVGHPDLEKWKYPLPGDSAIFMIERLVIHLDPQPKIVKLDMEPDAHRSTTSDHIAGRGGEFLDVEWSEDGNMLAFVSSSRDHKIAHLKVADPFTGEVTPVHREEVETYFESGATKRSWHILKESNEFIWYSEKSDWGHIYLYNLETGEMKNQITEDDWMVLGIEYIDQENRKIYFLGSNKEEGNPYYRYLYSIKFDGSDLKLLTPESANHNITWNEDYSLFVDSYSTEITPPITIIKNMEGDNLGTLAEGDITDLMASGWVAPVPFQVLARDSTTDLWGLMYKPSNFDPSKKYPILNYLYPGPQSGSVGSRSFRASRSDKQSLAELGFIVVEVDAMGSPGRSKSFHDIYYGNMGDNGLPDQMAMIKQLASENSWMDIDKVGIWGHSGGGFASTDAILRYPDFYKVAVSGAGNHDNRNYEDDWGEKWQGLLVDYSKQDNDQQSINTEVPEAPTGTNYDNQANQLLAENLKGKLLIAHGMMDGNVHPSNTLLVVDALIKADKDFDMLVFPNARHGFGNSRYFLKRRWDYFVRHLKGVNPPEGFTFGENIR